MARRGYSNVAYPIYLVGTLNNSDATDTISVSATSGGPAASPTGWPASRPYYIAIDPETPSEEICLVTDASGSSMTISRGTNLGSAAYGSATKAHASGAKIVHVATAADYDEANAHINASVAVHGLAGGSAVVGTTDTQTLSNKTLSPTTAVTGGGVVASTTGSQTLTNKLLSTGSSIGAGASIDSAVILTGGGDIVSTTATQTITGKTFTGPIINTPIISGATFKGGIFFDVRGYGAVGDGSTDDTVAIQATMDAASVVGGVTYVGGGLTYAQAATLRPPANTQLYIAAGSTIKRTANISMFINAAVGQNIGGYDGRSGIWVGGMGTIDANGVVQTGANNVLTFAHCQNITVQDITIKDTCGDHSIELNGVKTGRITNVKFLGYVNPSGSTYAYKEAVQIDLSKSAATTSVLPYDNTVCKDVLITGCTYGASGTPGTTPHNSAFGAHSGTVGVHPESIRFVNNYCDGMTFWGASAYAMTGVAIHDNYFVNCGAGVRADTIDSGDTEDRKDATGTDTGGSQDEHGVSIQGNTIRNLVGGLYNGDNGDAIRVWGETTGRTFHGSVIGNVVDTVANSGRGVNLLNANHFAVANNSLNSINGSGIYADTCTDTTISGNILASIGGTGVYATACTGLVVDSNRGRDITADGIQVANATTYFTISGNQLLYTGTHGINAFTSCADGQVYGNTIRGAGHASNGVSAGLRASASCARITWAFNKVRRHTTGPNYANALSFTNTCSEMKYFGNTLQDGVNTSGVAVVGSAILDASISPSTDAANVTAV